MIKMDKRGNYKGHEYRVIYVRPYDGRASFLIDGTVRFSGVAAACEYFFDIAKKSPKSIKW